ncbi:META domain-containing protein [Streptomyces sp. NPDC088757]|uniref:META domain-containing protein n=1 Tax=Streptomyces sp. NPDC088757 TaxID=3365889 RepID=UPI0037FDDDED
MRMYRTGIFLLALFAVTACGPSGPQSEEKSSDRPTPWVAPKGPGGYGGRLLGARWHVDWITVDGRNIDAPPDGGAWVEFGYDATAIGDYGCLPFKTSITVTATTLTLGAETSEKPDGTCSAEERAFTQRIRKVFTGGPLTVAKRVDAWSMTLKNPQGDYIALQMLWPQGFFGAPWRLQYLIGADATIDMVAGEEAYFVFHRDGTATGKAGCNTFKGRTAFAGMQVTLYPMSRTTHHTCSQTIMTQENWILRLSGHTYTIMTGGGVELLGDNGTVDNFGYHLVPLT